MQLELPSLLDCRYRNPRYTQPDLRTELSYADIDSHRGYFVCLARVTGIQHAGGPLQAAKSRLLSRMLKKAKKCVGEEPELCRGLSELLPLFEKDLFCMCANVE
jgi:hypothetical protein